MEPKSIANLNGAIVSSGGGSSSKGAKTPRSSKSRRESSFWVRTPPENGYQEGDEDLDWSCALLTPVPKTPAPEAVARYAAELPETPCEGDLSVSSPTLQALETMTCPQKASKYQNLGEGILGRDKDEQVLMRLMAARRKSLQFAPKIASPLSRAWK